MNSRTISALAETPSVPSLPAAFALDTAECCAGARRRSSNENGMSVTMQKTPTHIWVVRQPSVWMKYWMIGGQIVPPS